MHAGMPRDLLKLHKSTVKTVSELHAHAVPRQALAGRDGPAAVAPDAWQWATGTPKGPESARPRVRSRPHWRQRYRLGSVAGSRGAEAGRGQGLGAHHPRPRREPLQPVPATTFASACGRRASSRSSAAAPAADMLCISTDANMLAPSASASSSGTSSMSSSSGLAAAGSSASSSAISSGFASARPGQALGDALAHRWTAMAPGLPEHRSSAVLPAQTRLYRSTRSPQSSARAAMTAAQP